MGKLLGAAAVLLGLFGSLLLLPLFFTGPAGSASAAAATCTTEGFDTGTVPNGWGDDVAAAAETAGVPAAILAAQLEAESGWNAAAVSSVGAEGLAQFMPGTWERFGEGDPFDPAAAIAAQGRYMGHLMETLAPVAEKTGAPLIDLALAGYNAGPGAVQKHEGIPPYPQTQRYVAKISRAAASGYGLPCSATTTTGGSGASVGDRGDTYRFAEGPYCPLDGSGCMSGAVNTATGMYKRECVDWAIIELNADLGDTKAPYTWTNQTLLNGNGSAVYWKEQWKARGWTVSDTPAPDAIAWFAPGAAGAGAIGHVATVAAINKDGTVLIEEYNGQAPPDDHEYGTRTLPAGAVTKYLHLPEEDAA